MPGQDCIAIFRQLPTALIFKRLDSGEIDVSDNLLTHFAVRPGSERELFVQSLKFFDADTHSEFTGELHPLHSDKTYFRQRARVISNAGNHLCLLYSETIDIEGVQWKVVQVQAYQNIDLVQKDVDSTVANHINFTHLLSSISSRLINASDGQIDGLIEQCLGAFGEFCDIDRCYLFQFSDDGLMMDNTHEWVGAGVAPYKEELQGLSTSELPYFSQVIKNENVFCFSDIQLLPEEAFRERAEFEREDIRAVLCVAVNMHDRLYGFIGCDVLHSSYEWKQHDIRYLKLIGEMLSNTLQSMATRKSLEDVQTELTQANARLKELANRDGLTGIANRRLFDEQLDEEIRRGGRNDRSISLILVDVDKFKLFNDTYGHQAGDLALKQIASVLSSCCQRAGDMAARYGGEEFAVILPDADGVTASNVARNIQQAMTALSLPFDVSPVSPVVTLSIGIASEQCRSIKFNSQLITLADEALYRAKDLGRNQVVCGPAITL